MSQVQAVQTASEVLRMPPIQVQEWLRDVWAGRLEAPADFNWHGLAEAAASRATPLGGPPDVEWAKASVAVYEKLACELKPDGRESFLYSAMNLCAALIEKLGATRGHPVLDPALVVRWFFESLLVSREEAERQSELWRERGPESGVSMSELAELLRIKGRMKIVQSLIDGGHLEPDAELSRWLELRGKLPSAVQPAGGAVRK